MRSVSDRIRHALLFEILGICLLLPLGTAFLGLDTHEMGVIGVGSAIIATLWNYVYNLMFDRIKLRMTGTAVKTTVSVRVLHALLFEGGLIILILPPMALYLGISLYEALLLDAAIVVFYLVYAFIYNWIYDRVFPIPVLPEEATVQHQG